jgi:GTP-binding protein
MSLAPSTPDRPPVVAIVGRPNVGKSSLFNRIIGKRRAIVDDQPGVTRDRLVGLATGGPRPFVCVDTGGFDAAPARESELLAAVRRQALAAVEGAACVVFVVDARAGLAPADVELGRLLLRTGRPIVVAVNKVDTAGHAELLHDFHRLGIAPVIATSAAHGLGVTDLLEAVAARLPARAAAPTAATGTRLAVIGRPNVGKSSLTNRLLGEERLVVSEQAGTTRDTIDTAVVLGGRPYVLIDTAGIRRRGRIRDAVEGHGAVRALGMLLRSDIVAFVLDARDGITEQDARIVGRALEAGRGLVLVVNKWDLLARDATIGAWRHTVAGKHPALAVLPAVPVSARTGRGVPALVRTLGQVERAYRRRVATADLNRVLQDALARHAPPSPGGRPIRFFYATQTHAAPPAFTIFASAPSRVPPAFLRYLENVLRDAFGLAGVPITIRLRSRRETARPAVGRPTRDAEQRAPRSARQRPRAPRSRRR